MALGLVLNTPVLSRVYRTLYAFRLNSSRF